MALHVKVEKDIVCLIIVTGNAAGLNTQGAFVERKRETKQKHAHLLNVMISVFFSPLSPHKSVASQGSGIHLPAPILGITALTGMHHSRKTNGF